MVGSKSIVIRREKFTHRDINTRGECHVTTEAETSDTSMSQGMPRTDSNQRS